MSRGTQLDFFEPTHALKEIKTGLGLCVQDLLDIQTFFCLQQNTFAQLYLSLKQETEQQAMRLSRIEATLRK